MHWQAVWLVVFCFFFSFSFDIFTEFLQEFLPCTENCVNLQLRCHPGKRATWGSAIFLHKILFSTSSAAIMHRSCNTAGFQQRPLLSLCLPTNKEGTGWLLQRGVGRWLPVCCFRSEAANNEQWQSADSLLLSHSMWCMNGAKGMDMALGEGILVSCLFCPAHSRSQSIHGDIPLLHLVASPPSRAICLLTIARTLNRHQGREQCANVPLTPSSKQTAAQHRFHFTSGSAPHASEARTDQRRVPAGPWAWD